MRYVDVGYMVTPSVGSRPMLFSHAGHGYTILSTRLARKPQSDTCHTRHPYSYTSSFYCTSLSLVSWRTSSFELPFVLFEGLEFKEDEREEAISISELNSVQATIFVHVVSCLRGAESSEQTLGPSHRIYSSHPRAMWI